MLTHVNQVVLAIEGPVASILFFTFADIVLVLLELTELLLKRSDICQGLTHVLDGQVNIILHLTELVEGLLLGDGFHF